MIAMFFFNLGVIGRKSGRPRDAALSNFYYRQFPSKQLIQFFLKKGCMIHILYKNYDDVRGINSFHRAPLVSLTNISIFIRYGADNLISI